MMRTRILPGRRYKRDGRAMQRDYDIREKEELDGNEEGLEAGEGSGREDEGAGDEGLYGAPVPEGEVRSHTKKGRGFPVWLAILGAVLAGIILFAGYLYIVLPSRLPWGDDNMFTMLVIGTDVDYTGPATQSSASIGRADTAMLLLMPRSGRTAVVISIPRDTLVSTNGKNGKVRFNSLYKGLPPDDLITGVKTLTDLEVDRWMKVDFNAFVAFVDAIGGVEVDVEKTMKYTDRAGGYTLNLKPGVQVLDGKTSLAYVRYRNDALGDIARVNRQQQFVKAVASKVIRFSTISHLDDFKAILDEYVKNDLNFYELAAIGMRTLKVGPSNIDTTTLPGNFSGPYWQADKEKIQALVEEIKGGGNN